MCSRGGTKQDSTRAVQAINGRNIFNSYNKLIVDPSGAEPREFELRGGGGFYAGSGSSHDLGEIITGNEVRGMVVNSTLGTKANYFFDHNVFMM